MSKLGIFVDRKTTLQCRSAHGTDTVPGCCGNERAPRDFIFPVDIHKIPKMDGLFIRPHGSYECHLCSSPDGYFHGIPVIDDPESIQICSDKINMYSHLIKKKVSLPKNGLPVKE